MGWVDWELMLLRDLVGFRVSVLDLLCCLDLGLDWCLVLYFVS